LRKAQQAFAWAEPPTLIGMIEEMSDAKREAWLHAMRKLGTKAR